MRISKILIAGFAVVNGIAAAEKVEEYTMAEKLALMQGLSAKISNSQIQILEIFSDPAVIQKVQSIQARRKAGNLTRIEEQRELQDFFFTFGVDEIVDIFNFIRDSCSQELDDFNLGNLLESTGNLLVCIKDSFVGIVTGCVDTFRGFAEPLFCLIDLGITEADLDLIPDSEFQLSDNDGARQLTSILDGRPFSALTETEKIELVGLLDKQRDLQFESASDSAGTFNTLFSQVVDIATQNIDLDAETCLTFYGTPDDPSFFGCLSLFDAEFFADIQDFLEDGLPGESCTTLAKITGIDDLVAGSNLFSLAIFKPIEILAGQNFADCTQDAFNTALEGFRDVFSQCDDLDGGSLSAELNQKFPPVGVESSASSHFLSFGLLPVVILMIMKNEFLSL